MGRIRDNIQDLPLSCKANFLKQLASNFREYSVYDDNLCPKYQEITVSYKQCNNEDANIRYHTLKKIACLGEENKGFVKKAFDTRRVNQEVDRIPRRNLQFWHRSDEFIDEEKQGKINAFAHLYSVAKKIREEFETRPDWHDSYARILVDALERTLRIRQADGDIDPEQLKYLEQLLETRYGLAIDKIERHGELELYNKILKKDESLLKRGVIYKDKEKSEDLEEKIMNILAKLNKQENSTQGVNIYTNGNNSNNNLNEVLGSLFSGGARKEGEKTVTRTITISITDSAE